ncbi:MAG: hypothetical protein J6V57_03000 [Spirochaetaceae bacterium]|nr:hypothetical protein [Spirochaetaceae bacterium]
MENKAIKILSICLVALFTLAVLFFAVGLLVEYKNAPKVIDSTLNQFTSDVGVASEYYTPGTQQFSDVLRARIASNKTIAVVTIAQDNNVIFAYPLSSPFIVQGITGQPTVSAASSFVQVKSDTVELGSGNYLITSALYSLQPAVIYSYIRISFLIILAGTLIAGIALMYLYLTEQKQETETSFDDLATAQRLKNSKIDFPEVDAEASIDALADDGFDFPADDENQFFDENNLPEEAFEFPPADEIPVESHFVLPQEEELEQQEISVEDFQSPEVELDYPMPPVEEETVQQEDFVPPPVEGDLTEITDNDYVVEDFKSFEQELEPPVEENPIYDTEPEIPSETELENAVVTQAKFTQENLDLPASENASKDEFNIDKALQGYEPPVKEVPQEIDTTKEPDFFEPVTDNLHEPVQESVESPEVTAESSDVSSEPAGLFSPVTGFGWEAYLEERLDSELIRSASSEEDIGLMIVRIQGLDKTDQRNKAIYDTLLEFYKFRDLIFEYGNDGFSCIVHSINVDAALDLAEQVYVALSKILKDNGMDNEIGIGISTRSFRLIPGKRIFEEAEQALIRAFADLETAIVAFRVDPEKYRQYISAYADEEQ